MKKSSKSSSKKRDRSSPDDSKAKRTKNSSSLIPHAKGKAKEDSKSVPRKTRWQAEDKKDDTKNVPTPDPSSKNKEKSGPTPRIRDCLHDKDKIVELLFQTVTGAALQELIPDYLKKRSKDELKKLCLEQIKKMTDEVIVEVISGKVDSSYKEEKSAEKEEILKPEEPRTPKKSEEEKKVDDEKTDIEKKSEASSVAVTEKLPHDALQQETEAGVTGINETACEGNQIPFVIKDEVAKDLILPERDAELLELEMRARAIRALLKAKSQSTNEDEGTNSKEDY